ncbi:hypothetical protein BD414DRAFT_493732 [Trametes punicea]|nr:hypothetical protein BD414DRAFT_493732 [Trametes punicea]
MASGSVTCREKQLKKEEGEPGPSHAEQRRSQQLDDIINLLDESGMIQDSGDVKEHRSPSPEAVLSDTDESAGVATPPLIVSRPGSSSSFSVISQPQGDSPEEVPEKPDPEAKKVEHILELLDVQQHDVAVATQASEKVHEEEANDDCICAYAI